ncbi:MAG: hypothetical protein UY72_C0043G0001 [Candidatus Uhrbacteria bacterium GW2011_GWD2_52_7]|uniref:Uncharacterized protein n=1 Tax=Candidatus Uhrbacteria bacterium GW2011_GWD2_52_7 TaxID=1618989 RepID=A0A0G1XEZ1_9BACT|nr:MAG: hypothetical protein UY72_C0043G0001 [Candidatus Uhrbacteria bacterium GW2011_GWD2_52_7]
MQFENVALALGYGLFYVDLIFQIRRLLKTRSSRDVSAQGVAIRLIAAVLFQLKYFSVHDLPLIVGGLVYTFLVAIYALLAFRFRK